MTTHFRIEVQAADKGWGVMVLDDRNGKALSRASDSTNHASAVRRARRLAAGYKKTPLAASVTVFDERSGDYLLEWRRPSVRKRGALRPVRSNGGSPLDEANALREAIVADIRAPHVAARVDTLGGAHRPSVGIWISLDPKSEWHNGIFHNSRYGIFSANFPEMSLSISASHGVTRLRKTKFKSAADAVAKLNKWVTENSGSRPTRTNRPRARSRR